MCGVAPGCWDDLIAGVGPNVAVMEVQQETHACGLDLRAADAHFRRSGNEPLRAPRELARIAVAPEVIARLALGKREAMAGRKGSLAVRAAETPEDQDLFEINEREPRRTAANVIHQQRDALRVIDHRHTPIPQQTAFAGRVASLPLQERELCEAGTQ